MSIDSDSSSIEAEDLELEDLEIPYDMPGDLLDNNDYRQFYVLSSVISVQQEEGYARGVDVMDELEERFNVEWKEGTAYPIIYELHREDYLEMEEQVNSKHYFVMDKGVNYVEEFVEEFTDLAASLAEMYVSIEAG